jgi:hypothetical protein
MMATLGVLDKGMLHGGNSVPRPWGDSEYPGSGHIWELLSNLLEPWGQGLIYCQCQNNTVLAPVGSAL